MTKMNIAKTLDINSLNCEINVKNPCYLIMNNDTVDGLGRLTCENFHSQKVKNGDGYYVAYKGIPIAFCDYLEYGEVILV